MWPVFAAAVVVIGGALASAAFSTAKPTGLPPRLGASQTSEGARLLLALPEKARKLGPAAFEDASVETKDPFLREALLLASGGMDSETLCGLLSRRMRAQMERFAEAGRFWGILASAFSSWGMLGALAGLAIASQGAGYAADGFHMSLCSTGLGVLASCVALPMKARTECRAETYSRCARMAVDVLLRVKAGEKPGYIEESIRASLGGAL